ncbi:MAG: hypothetical protein FJ044_02120 [Candidatus Cloacimonetes bacterium]|nr:hypothetical protein [Candidatus Cloacimonadota bacterium]
MTHIVDVRKRWFSDIHDLIKETTRHACWTLYYELEKSWSYHRCYRVAVGLIFNSRLQPTHFEVSGITGGKKRAKLSKRAVIEALLDTEAEIQSWSIPAGPGY